MAVVVFRCAGGGYKQNTEPELLGQRMDASGKIRGLRVMRWLRIPVIILVDPTHSAGRSIKIGADVAVKARQAAGV